MQAVVQPHAAQADAEPHAAAAEDDEPEEAASIAVARSIDVPGRGVVTMHELTMPDRSRAGNRETRWLLQAQLESAIYGCEGNSTGAFYKLLARCSLLGTVLSVDKKAVVAGHVLQPEYDEIMRCLATPQARKVRPQRRGTSLSHSPVSAHPPHVSRLASAPPRALSLSVPPQANLVPVTVAISAVKSLGDGARVRAVLQGLRQPLPRAWQLR